MFGAVCSGRPIQLANQVETTKYVITIPNASNISYVAIFLLPQTEFVDPNFTALVYFQLPNSNDFKLLGGLNPLKPSAIYRLKTGTNHPPHTTQLDDMDMNDGTPLSDDETINIGISIEPTPHAEALLQEETQRQQANANSLVPSTSKLSLPTPKNPQDIAALANKVVTHAYNYLGSFIDNSGKVPMKAFDTWWEKFKSKLSNNPDFLNELS